MPETYCPACESYSHTTNEQINKAGLDHLDALVTIRRREAGELPWPTPSTTGFDSYTGRAGDPVI